MPGQPRRATLQLPLDRPTLLVYSPNLKLKSDFNFVQILERFCLMPISSRSSLLLVFLALVAHAAFAQTPVNKPVLRGRVVDPNHAGIPGADIWASGNELPSSSEIGRASCRERV